MIYSNFLLQQIKMSLLTVKEKGGNKPGRFKRQKLNSDCDVEDNGGITTGDLGTPNSHCKQNDRSCSDSYPVNTSRYLSANRVVECVFCHSFRITEVNNFLYEPLVMQINLLVINSDCIMQ